MLLLLLLFTFDPSVAVGNDASDDLVDVDTVIVVKAAKVGISTQYT